MSPPLVGIIVPCFNQGRFAAECVASLEAQTWTHWRAVVVDDASTDDSAELMASLASDRVEIVRLTRNLGRALVRNEAVRRLGPVDYVLNVDCDDRLSATYVAALVAALEAERSAGLAYGTLHYFGDGSGNRTWPLLPFEHASRFLENRIPGPGVMFRAEALAATRGWRREFTNASGEDWDIWLQVVERGWNVVWVRDAVYEYRQHAGSFLSGRPADLRMQHDLLLFALHHRAIRASGTLREFLAARLIPEIASAIRRRRLSRAAKLALPLLRSTPWTACSLLARHYASRLRGILGSG